MVNLIDDGSLIGYWPLNEASGAPIFHNWAKFYGTKPSGISFDLHVHNTVNDTAGLAVEEKHSFWPGQASITEQGPVPGNGGSGTTWKGLQLNGQADKNPFGGGYSKVLLLGAGGWATRRSYTPPPSYPATGTLVGSGFTIGFWVNPRTNGYTDIPLISQHNRGLSQRHSLIAREHNGVGFYVGVSGFLDNDYRYAVEADPRKQLKAFAHIMGSTTAGAAHLTAPVLASGWSHITFTHEKASTGNDYNAKLYKDGVLQNSSTYSVATPALSLTSASTAYTMAALTIGGTNIDTFSAQSSDTGGLLYEAASGWGHLISGVYLFNRVLSASEIFDMDEAGGIYYQAGIGIPSKTSIAVNDPNLIGYYPFTSPGFIDASRHKNPLIADMNHGDISEMVSSAGPFNKGGVGISAGTYGLASISGLTNSFVGNGSFTIAGWFSPRADTSNYATNVLASFGAIDSIYNQIFGNKTMGFLLNVGSENSSTSLRCRFYQDGNPANFVGVSGYDRSIYRNVAQHICIMHDSATNGVAMYLNGELSQSGSITKENQTLNLSQHIQKIAGSGFPLLFLNGVDDTGTAPNLVQTPDVWLSGGGVGSSLHDLAIFNKTLNNDEIRGLCYDSIDLSPVALTLNDPRLMVYWSCQEAQYDPFIIPDKARSFDKIAANLTAAASDLTWEKTLSSVQQSAFAKIDVFNQIRQTPPELASQLPLGITSGSWVAAGGSYGSESTTNALTRSQHRLSSLPAIGQRFRPNTDIRSVHALNPYEEYILSFEVTPSGNIPRTVLSSLGSTTVARDFNSNLIEVCQDYADSNKYRLQAFLTSLNDGDPLTLTPNTSGVSLVFIGSNNTAATTTPLVSGNVAFGIPNRIMLHVKPETPNRLASAGSEDLRISLWIDGELTHSRVQNSTSLRAGSDALQSAGVEFSTIMIGGVPVRDATELTTNHESGLGEIYMRNIFVMKGNFSDSELSTLATTGIDLTTSLDGMTDAQQTTLINIEDPNLLGYWRFSGSPVGSITSGTRDLSFKQNHLFHLARSIAEQGNSGPWANLSASNPAHNLRYIPAMHSNSSLAVKCSGITFDGNIFNNNVAVSPFIASGADFYNLDAGFSIGFWYCQKEVTPVANVAKYIMGWGLAPNTSQQTTTANASWSIVLDDAQNIKMILSKDGKMYYDAGINAAKAGSVECGVFKNADNDNNEIENFKQGLFGPAHPSSWNHYVWTYDGTYAKCYLNGNQVDYKYVGAINVPYGPGALEDNTQKLISFFVPQVSAWTWKSRNDTNTVDIADFDGILTDVFCFDKALTEPEVRYVCYNGIADVPRVEVSGIFGGYTHGLDSVSGIYASYIRGLDLASGIFANYTFGVYDVSGIIGGYIDGLAITTLSGIFANYIKGAELTSGIFASFIPGLDVSSGIMAGYTRGLDTTSGIFGAMTIGGLLSRVDFDSSYQVSAKGSKSFDSFAHIFKTNSEDFDAKAYVYQDELPPYVEILVPYVNVSGLVPPFNQYFVATASGRQGKTIASTRWTFGDLTPMIIGTVSGNTGTSNILSQTYSNNNLYTENHVYAQSGFFIAKFEAVDSNGLHGSDSLIVSLASGIDPVYITISGVPRQGYEDLVVDFSTKIERMPNGVSLITQLTNFGDGKTSIISNPTHTYVEPGEFNPVFIVRDSRGVIWSDSIQNGIDYKESGGHDVWQ